MQKTVFTKECIFIETYPEAKAENLPMFAENRVHQRTSGNPYPNKVVLEAQRKIKEKRKYTLLKLENEFLEIGILPELGGKIWYAKDKKTGYDFFYKNNVVKPALIGVLGSWTSGGVEFNWPFHHRASTFMPVDYAVEETEEGIIVWLSEHDPIDRMKGMVGVSLKHGESVFETKVKLDNLTPVRKPFLWWENAAVPVHEQYSIFFPEDVNYVRFHYKRSVTTYPIANNEKFGAYNGIYFNGDTDISQHKNTRQATSYFSAESEFDYFGGYDHAQKAGVVHIADHHISPGKKMFTWAYSQLAKTWENALTDNDGQYAELMAGCYSDNQPDFAWLAPYETKTFSQFWFPIHGAGTPDFACQNGALYFRDGALLVACVKPLVNAKIAVKKGETVSFEKTLDLPAWEVVRLCDGVKKEQGVSVEIFVQGEKAFSYTVEDFSQREIPEPRKELPNFKEVRSAQELYLLGLHIEQYRSPDYSAEACYLEALERDGEFVPALTALAEIYFSRLQFEKAKEYIERAERSASRFNIRLESGKIHYLKGLIMAGLKRFDKAKDSFEKSAWNYDYKAAASLHLGLLAMRKREYFKAAEKLKISLSLSDESVVARPFLAYAKFLSGERVEAEKLLNKAIEKDRLNLFAYAFQGIIEGDFSKLSDLLNTDATQVVLDLCSYLLEADLKEEVLTLVKGLEKTKRFGAVVEYLKNAYGKTRQEVISAEGIAFPSRSLEEEVLKKALMQNPSDTKARYLLGCLLYGKGRYGEGIDEFKRVVDVEPNHFAALRNLAVGAYSYQRDENKAKEYMALAAKYSPADEKQITFERAYLMAKTGDEPKEIERFIRTRNYDRDDLVVELARAYNHQGKAEEALRLLLDRAFVACEGGEHYIADQYTYARYLLGKRKMKAGDYLGAMEEFDGAQELPQSLGSGFWNDVKRVPFRYFKALCLIKAGREEEAKQILSSFQNYYFDYFSNMYLSTLPYYVARSFELCGEKEKGVRLMQRFLLDCERAMTVQDAGHFSTTPFFISFIDEPKTARQKALAYPCYLYAKFLGDREKTERYQRLLATESYGTYLDDSDVL